MAASNTPHVAVRLQCSSELRLLRTRSRRVAGALPLCAIIVASAAEAFGLPCNPPTAPAVTAAGPGCIAGKGAAAATFSRSEEDSRQKVWGAVAITVTPQLGY